MTRGESVHAPLQPRAKELETHAKRPRLGWHKRTQCNCNRVLEKTGWITPGHPFRSQEYSVPTS